MTVFTISALVLRPVCGNLIDRYGRKSMLLLGILVFSISTAPVGLSQNLYFIYILQVFSGLSFSIQTVALTTIVTDLVPESRLTEGLGYFGLTASITQAIGPSLAAWSEGLAGYNVITSYSIHYTKLYEGFFGIMILVNPSAALMKMAVIPFGFVMNYDFAVIPMFLLMANIILVSGLGADLYNIASKWLGRRSGGLAVATTVACAGFAAISGSGLATSLTIGQTAMPEMKKYNYDTAFSAAVICASGTIGLLIPPSTALMVYGIVTGTSIRSLFIAGFIPGVTEALFYIVLITIMTIKKP